MTSKPNRFKKNDTVDARLEKLKRIIDDLESNGASVTIELQTDKE